MRFVLIIILGVFLFSPASPEAGNFRIAVDSLTDYPLDSVIEIEIDNLNLPLAYGHITLRNGLLFLTGNLNNRPTVAFFMGHGKFKYLPPDDIEAQQVKRFYFSDSIDIIFDQAYFAFPCNSKIFSDITGDGKLIKPPYRVKTFLKSIRKVPDKKFKYNLPLDIYRASIENQPEFLWINLLKDRYQHTVYYYDPYVTEQVSLYKYTSNFKTPQIVSSIEDKNVRIRSMPEYQFDLSQYDIDVDISTTGKSGIGCTMTLEIKADSLKLVSFNFPSEYEIDSVLGDVVDSASFIKKKDRPGLTIELSDFFYRGDTAEIKVFYRTNLFRHYMHYGVIQEHLTLWYPSNGYRRLSNYDINYRINKDFGFISVGEKSTDSTIGDTRLLEYKSSRPIAYISFNYGVFDSIKVENSDIPITIHFLRSDRSPAILGNPNIVKVVDDIAASFKFFNDSFAPYPFDRLDAASMAVGFGQGSPGLVHLSKTTFNRTIKGVDDKFRAHEVAHQWWGHLINPKSYRDVWLSEGFAEYSAAMYIELIKKDEKTFRKILKNWRKAIISGGKTGAGNSVGYRAGAIVLGHRLGSEMSPEDFVTIVYYKAAFLLHMLRYELEREKNKNGSFLEMLSQYANRFSGQLVTTEDFIDIVRPFLGEKTNQFFNQWLYDWRVPKIKKKKKIRDDGTIDIGITVSKVGENFESPYPVKFIFSDSSDDTIIYNIKNGVNQFQYIVKNGLKVKSVKFNPDYDILEQ